MAQNVLISCSCGNVRGHLSEAGPDHGDHFTCYCSDCRDFVRLMGLEERALDDHGGVSVYQTRVGKMSIDAGLDHLAAVHMTDKPTTRWYASCCNTPFFNTINKAKPAFLSVVTTCLAANDTVEVLGPSRGNIFPEEADPPHPAGKSPSKFGMMLRFAPRIVKDTFGGDWRKSPLFDAETLEPIVEPRPLTQDERVRLGRG